MQRGQRKSLEHRDAFAQGGGKVELAAHRAFGDRRNLRLDARHVGKLVQALAIDDRGIHVRDQKLFAPVRGRQHIHIDRMAGEVRACTLQDLHGIMIERDLQGAAGGEPDLAPDIGQRHVHGIRRIAMTLRTCGSSRVTAWRGAS